MQTPPMRTGYRKRIILRSAFRFRIMVIWGNGCRAMKYAGKANQVFLQRKGAGKITLFVVTGCKKETFALTCTLISI
jgi:hypothetical protein